MTVLCAGGTSRPKPGVNEVIIFSSSQLASFLNNKGGLWASLAIGALGVLSYQATELCNSDPPAAVPLTPAEYKAILELSPADVLGTALGKLKDTVTQALWYDLCECSAVTTPQPPTGILNPPSGVTQPDYGLTPCAQPRLRVPIRPQTNNADDSTNITREAFPNLSFARAAAAGGNLFEQEVAQIPTSWVNLVLEAQFVSGNTVVNEPYTVLLTFYNANRSGTVGQIIVGANQTQTYERQPATGSFTIPTTARYFSLNALGPTTATQAGSLDFSMTVGCSGSIVTQPGCCQDPVLYSLLNSIMQQVQLTRTDVELLQRYGLPFEHVTGPTHVGLTGTGSLAIGRSVGVGVTVTAFPPGNSQMLGEPPYIFDLGWISVITDDGLLDEIRLTRTSTRWMSKLIPSATRVGWGLRDGVTVTITELLPEP
ncbi:MAG TPA: hypothetical protein VF077_12720 [Nitrospiraceae bacterium]